MGVKRGELYNVDSGDPAWSWLVVSDNGFNDDEFFVSCAVLPPRNGDCHEWFLDLTPQDISLVPGDQGMTGPRVIIPAALGARRTTMIRGARVGMLSPRMLADVDYALTELLNL